MIPINKSSIPNGLIEHKQKESASYDNIPSDIKDELKESLLSEQNGICAYCMCRIKKETMHIEHWHPQYIYTNEELEYDNMLAVCSGTHYGRTVDLCTCDKKKDNKIISFNPAKFSDHTKLKIKYRPDGEIISEDSVFNSELNAILNLNIKRLKLNRKKTLSSFTAYIGRSARRFNKEQLQKIADNYCFNGENLEYRGIIDYYVAKR